MKSAYELLNLSASLACISSKINTVSCGTNLKDGNKTESVLIITSTSKDLSKAVETFGVF